MAETLIQQFNRVESLRRGIDPAITEAAWNTEGGLIVPCRIGKFETGWSFWSGQLHYGGQEYPQYGTVAGMGSGFTRFTGWQPGDVHAWRDALRYALDEVKAAGWRSWYGPATIGITGMRGVDPNFYWEGTPAGEWDFRNGLKAPIEILYDATASVDQQDTDYTCALEAAGWLLRSSGRTPARAWLKSQLVPGIISPDVGLRDGSGQQLAEWLTREYGVEGGWTAQHSPVSFDDVLAGAGVNPTLIGGHRWGVGGHWSGVRGREGDALLLANSANGYNGIDQRMSRAEWDARGPWDAIWIDRLSTLPAQPVPEPPAFDKQAVIAALREILARHEAYDAAMRADLARLLALAEAA